MRERDVDSASYPPPLSHAALSDACEGRDREGDQDPVQPTRGAAQDSKTAQKRVQRQTGAPALPPYARMWVNTTTRAQEQVARTMQDSQATQPGARHVKGWQNTELHRPRNDRGTKICRTGVSEIEKRAHACLRKGIYVYGRRPCTPVYLAVWENDACTTRHAVRTEEGYTFEKGAQWECERATRRDGGGLDT